MGHTLSDNRHGLITNAVVTQADGYAEREAAKAMINDARQALGDDEREITLGADKGYDAKEFIDACQANWDQKSGAFRFTSIVLSWRDSSMSIVGPM